MPWQSSADQTEKKHTDTFSRAREGEAACDGDAGNKNHTVVLEVAPRTTTTHSGVEGLSGPCRGRVPKTRQKTFLRVSATRCCKLPERGVREHLPRTDDHAVAQYCIVGVGGARASTEWLTTTKWHWRKREVFSNVTLLGINRILVRSDNERTLLSLIEHVMSNLTGVELVQCSWNQGSWSRFARQPTRAVELWRQRPTRAARGRGVCGAGAPAVRPQHVEVRVEENRSTWKCVLRRNRRFTMYARRISTSTASRQRLEEQ